NFAAFPITFGIGVDYAVNIMARFRQERARRPRDALPTEPARAVERSVLSTGGAVALCSLTTIIGYSSLLLAKNQALFLFGAVAGAAPWAAAQGALAQTSTVTSPVPRRSRASACC